MKIIKQGKIYTFTCEGCGCEFIEGANNVTNCGFFYRSYCPMCESECRCKPDAPDGSIAEE